MLKKKKKTKINNVTDDDKDVENEVDKILGTTDDKKKTTSEKADPDFSFETEAEKAVDEIQKSDYSDEKKPKVHHITEKIQLGMEMRTDPPDKGFLGVKAETGMVKYKDRYGEEFLEKKVIITSKDIHDVEYVEITDGLFNIDLRNDANFWGVRSPVVVPSMITQAVRTHLDIKKCHEPEKRKIEIPILLILALVGGAAIIIIMLWSLLG